GMRGAQIFVFDVVRSTSSAPVIIGGPPPMPVDDPTAGLLRFSWLQPSGAPAGDSPDDARLLTALEEAIPRSSTMGDLVTELSKIHNRREKTYPNLTYDRY